VRAVYLLACNPWYTYWPVILEFQWIATGMILEILHSLGKLPDVIEELKMYVIKGKAEPITNFTNSKGTPSRPTGSDLM
jgi:hypothetical protein